MEMVKFLDLHAQYLEIKGEIDEAIAGVISESAFVGGRFVQRFEREFADFIGVKYALGVANGTDALEIALEALELPEESEVLVPANSFAASAEAVIRNRLKVVFVDCDDSYTMDIDDMRAKITQNTRAIIPVHLYGQPADMDAIMSIAREKNLKVIEDCAQAHGAKYNGNKVGAIGDVGCFSFYPGKNLGAYGDGGMIVSNDLELIARCTEIAHHGAIEKYHHLRIGRNSRLDGLQAAILSVKLRHLKEWTCKRQEIARIYMERLGNKDGIALPKVRELCECVWHLFVIRLNGNASELAQYLREQGIESGYHYPIALPNQQAFKQNPSVKSCTTLRACEWDSHIISLPMGEHLGRAQAERVVEAVLSWLEREDSWFDSLCKKIESHRENLIAQRRILRVIDYGAGDPKAPRTKELMAKGVEVMSDTSKMARIGLKGESLKLVLETLKAQNARTILELGTCCGFSSSYMSHIAPQAKIHTIEGSPEIADVAKDTHEALGCANIERHVGRFVDVLPTLLGEVMPIDFAFVDGHHDRDATIEYFRQILPFMAERGIMVFDDISWSEGMKEAWKTILESGAYQNAEEDGKVGILWL